jgi:hypothetical protein
LQSGFSRISGSIFAIIQAGNAGKHCRNFSHRRLALQPWQSVQAGIAGCIQALHLGIAGIADIHCRQVLQAINAGLAGIFCRQVLHAGNAFVAGFAGMICRHYRQEFYSWQAGIAVMARKNFRQAGNASRHCGNARQALQAVHAGI